MSEFLVAEQEVREDGQSAAIAVEAPSLLLTLGITDIVEQESLDVTLHGSTDGETWTAKPVAAFPQKFYKGVSAILVDLAATPEVRFLQARWKVNRWGRGDLTPRFRFYVFAEPGPA